MVPGLAGLDVELARAFEAQRATSGGASYGSLRLAQLTFLRLRDACQADEACLRGVMQTRLTQLQTGNFNGPAAATLVQPSGPPLDRMAAAAEAARRQRFELMEQRRAALIQQRLERRDGRLAQRTPEERQQAMLRLFGSQNVDPPLPPDSTPSGEEWRGVYRCDDDHFLRLVMPQPPDGTGHVHAVLEFGPGPDGAASRGSFSVVGSVTAGAGPIHLEPDAWLHRPQELGQVAAFGLQGVRQPDGRIMGTVLGGPECKGFRAWHVAHDPLPDNPEGLLPRVPLAEPIPDELSLADCRNYANWLVSGHELHIASYYVSSLFYDIAGQQRVLGRTVDSWHTGDYRRLNKIAHTCQDQLGKSAALSDADLVRRITLYIPEPLGDTPFNWLSPNWDRAELAGLLSTEARQRAADRLARLAALPPVPGSFVLIDREAEALRGRLDELRYLEDGDRAAYQKQIAAQRTVLAHAVVTAMLHGFDQLPPTVESLSAMKATAGDTAEALRRAHEPDAADDAETRSAAAAAAKAQSIWPLFLNSAAATIRTLSPEDYHRFSDLIALRDGEKALIAAAPAPNADAYRAYLASVAATTEAMVERSMPRLLAWVAAMPPSAAANKKLTAFTSVTFGSAGAPDRFAELRTAIAAKLAAYNPEHYSRPDIVMSLGRHLWPEVPTEGLEDLSYFATALHQVNELCPGSLPADGTPESGALAQYVLDRSFRATQRIMSGRVQNQAEGQRFVLLALNGIMNRPGCHVTAYGAITSCTTAEEQNEVNEAILTSGDAISDMQTLTRHGCGSQVVTGYVAASIEFARYHADQPGSLGIADAWSVAATNN